MKLDIAFVLRKTIAIVELDDSEWSPPSVRVRRVRRADLPRWRYARRQGWLDVPLAEGWHFDFLDGPGMLRCVAEELRIPSVGALLARLERIVRVTWSGGCPVGVEAGYTTIDGGFCALASASAHQCGGFGEVLELGLRLEHPYLSSLARVDKPEFDEGRPRRWTSYKRSRLWAMADQVGHLAVFHGRKSGAVPVMAAHPNVVGNTGRRGGFRLHPSGPRPPDWPSWSPDLSFKNDDYHVWESRLPVRQWAADPYGCERAGYGVWASAAPPRARPGRMIEVVRREFVGARWDDGPKLNRAHLREALLMPSLQYSVTFEASEADRLEELARSGVFVFVHFAESNLASGPYGPLLIPSAPVTVDSVRPELRHLFERQCLPIDFATADVIQPAELCESRVFFDRILMKNGRDSAPTRAPEALLDQDDLNGEPHVLPRTYHVVTHLCTADYEIPTGVLRRVRASLDAIEESQQPRAPAYTDDPKLFNIELTAVLVAPEGIEGRDDGSWARIDKGLRDLRAYASNLRPPIRLIWERRRAG